MPVKVRPYRGQAGVWEVDIQTEIGGRQERKRLRSPCNTQAQSRRWGEAKEREWIKQGTVPKRSKGNSDADEPQAVPTVAEFKARFLGHKPDSRVRYKASTMKSKESALRVHIIPTLGSKRLDAITDADWRAFRDGLDAKLTGKTVNNILSVLKSMLDLAVGLGVLQELPCKVALRTLRAGESERPFHTFDDYEAQRVAAASVSDACLAAVLLGGDAGLRLGEIIALRIRDVSFETGYLHVRKSVWKGVEDLPKGGKPRRVLMIPRLQAALKAVIGKRKSGRVLLREDGTEYTDKTLRTLIRKASDLAGTEHHGVHVLRHTFCSHLAMKGVAAFAIQKAAGHADIKTTQNYMHLSPDAEEKAMLRLEDEAA